MGEGGGEGGGCGAAWVMAGVGGGSGAMAGKSVVGVVMVVGVRCVCGGGEGTW